MTLPSGLAWAYLPQINIDKPKRIYITLNLEELEKIEPMEKRDESQKIKKDG